MITIRPTHLKGTLDIPVGVNRCALLLVDNLSVSYFMYEILMIFIVDIDMIILAS